jgi:hypothetical protein
MVELFCQSTADSLRATVGVGGNGISVGIGGGGGALGVATLIGVFGFLAPLFWFAGVTGSMISLVSASSY